MTDLRYSDVEDDLRASVRQLLADHAGEPDLWRRLAVDLGLAGLAIPEEHGGAGATWREAAVVLEELGRALASVPFLGSAVVATAVLVHCGATDLLPGLAAGERTAALAVPFSTMPGGVSPTVRVEGDRLTGTVTSVADAVGAGFLLVPTENELFAVEASDVHAEPVVSLDTTRPLVDLTLSEAHGRRLATGTAAVDAGLRTGAGLLAAEQLGVADWCLNTTVAYVQGRIQFARPVGSFQAVKHRLADVWVAVAQARAASRYAADCLATGDPDVPVAVALAQAYCGPTAVGSPGSTRRTST
jgi:alkylation response protein AidB-like acyl-CoA dehydrogenase